MKVLHHSRAAGRFITGYAEALRMVTAVKWLPVDFHQVVDRYFRAYFQEASKLEKFVLPLVKAVH